MTLRINLCDFPEGETEIKWTSLEFCIFGVYRDEVWPFDILEAGDYRLFRLHVVSLN